MPPLPFALRPTDLLDMGVVAVFLWVLLGWLRTTRARFALLGLGILGIVYLMARGLDLQMTAWILQGFFAVFVLVVVVVFQEDLRRFFERIAVWGLRRQPSAAPADATSIVTRAVARMAKARTGALIVFPGLDPLDRHIEGGISLGGRLSEPLLLSLFDPHSPGHDGAVLMEGDRVSRFAVHLPLSNDQRQLGAGGTRHAAALGLAERTDALCVVVSEERGTVSVASRGRLRVLAQPEALAGELRRFRARTVPDAGHRPSLAQRLLERWPETVLALGLTVGLWLVFVPGSTPTERVRVIPVRVENLPAGFELERVEPPELQVTLRGSRRDVYFADASDMEVVVDALLVQLGRRTFEINAGQVQHPERVAVVDVQPTRVRLSVRKAESPPPAEGNEG